MTKIEMAGDGIHLNVTAKGRVNKLRAPNEQEGQHWKEVLESACELNRGGNPNTEWNKTTAFSARAAGTKQGIGVGGVDMSAKDATKEAKAAAKVERARLARAEKEARAAAVQAAKDAKAEAARLAKDARSADAHEAARKAQEDRDTRAQIAALEAERDRLLALAKKAKESEDAAAAAARAAAMAQGGDGGGGGGEGELPPGWRRVVDSRGYTYFYHPESEETTWDLAVGWDEYVDDSGRPYWHHKKSKTSWYRNPMTVMQTQYFAEAPTTDARNRDHKLGAWQ